MLVVVASTTVLLTIAVPTFRGAENTGEDRQAKTSLANALYLARTVFADTGSYVDATATDLTALESTLTFVSASTASTTERTVSVSATATEWAGAVLSRSGTCFKAQATASAGVVTSPTSWSTGSCAASGLSAASTALSLPVSGAVAWFDGNDLDGDGYSEGDNENCSASQTCSAAAEVVSRWVDKGSLAATVSASSGAEPVFVQDGYNNRGTVRFDGISRYLFRNTVSYTSLMGSGTNTTIFLVQRASSAQAGTPFALGSSNPTRLTMFTPYTDNAAYFDTYSSTTARVSASSQSALVSAWHQLTGRRSSGTQELFEDGTSIASTTSASGTTSGTATLVLGALSTSANYWGGDIAELIVYASALNDTQRGQVEAYLIAKWGTP